MKQLELNIIIPVHNEAESLHKLVDRLNPIADTLRADKHCSVTYIFVDDGSSDNSGDRLTELSFGAHSARLLRLSRNFGKEAALSAGIDAAVDADLIIMMDADLQHPPELIFDLIETWETEKVDSVYTYKKRRRDSEGLLKSGFARLFYWVMNHGARFHITENAGDFRLITRRYADALRTLPESERFMKGLYSWVGFQQSGIPLTPPPREHGTSSFNMLRLLAMSFDAITSFTTTPLRLMALFGLGVAALSALYGIYIVLERIFIGNNSVGLASILALIAFFGGLQMIYLGLVGEYIGKAVLEAKRRPGYIIAQEDDLNAPSPSADHTSHTE